MQLTSKACVWATTLALAVCSTPALAKSKSKALTIEQAKSNAIEQIVNIHDRIEKEGLEKVLKNAKWPKASDFTDSQKLANVASFTDNPFDDCFINPTMNGCGSGDTWGGFNPYSQNNLQLRDDGIQIISVEVLYQTLTFFKVKHYFGKQKKPTNANNNNNPFGDGGFGGTTTTSNPGYTWTFKVISPVEGQYYNDLDTEAVLGAMREFRKYVIALLCNDPNPNRMLAMMNKFDVGTRFRWDMAWALLGNQLPDQPNRYMVFGAKWRKFSMAIDGIQNTSVMRLRDPNGGEIPFNPGPIVQGTVATGGGSMSTLGYISREIIGLVRLAGDIIAEFLNLFCISDLSVDAKKEMNKQQAVYKLLDVKKKAWDRYGPLRPVLEELGKKASEASGKPVSFMP